MRNAAQSMGIAPLSAVSLADIVSPFVWYRFLAAGNQVDAGGNGPTLVQGNTAAAVGAFALDFASDTYYAHAANDAHLSRICEMTQWTDGAAHLTAFTAVIPTTPSAALFAVQWGMDNINNGGWSVAISTAREIQMKWARVGASDEIQEQNFLDPTPTAAVRTSFVLEQYLTDDDTLQMVVYANGAQVGSLTDVDLSAEGGSGLAAVERQLTVGARRTATSTYQAYFGGTANAELSNLFMCRLATRDTALAQALSAWWADYPLEPPRPMVGR